MKFLQDNQIRFWNNYIDTYNDHTLNSVEYYKHIIAVWNKNNKQFKISPKETIDIIFFGNDLFTSHEYVISKQFKKFLDTYRISISHKHGYPTFYRIFNTRLSTKELPVSEEEVLEMLREFRHNIVIEDSMDLHVNEYINSLSTRKYTVLLERYFTNTLLLKEER